MPFNRLAALSLAASFIPPPALALEPKPIQIEAVDVPHVALTPETLTAALTCRSQDAYRAFWLQLVGATDSIPWLDSYFAEEANGMTEMYAFRLEAPIAFFDRTVGSVFFTWDGVFASLPRADALRLIADQKLERLPARLTQQYYRFADAKAGAVLTAFEPEQAALSAALNEKLGIPHKPAPPPDTIFVGCSYTRLSPKDFVKRATFADERLEAKAELFALKAKARSRPKP